MSELFEQEPIPKTSWDVYKEYVLELELETFDEDAAREAWAYLEANAYNFAELRVGLSEPETQAAPLYYTYDVLKWTRGNR